MKEITVEEGAACGTLPTTAREGYTFGGWFMTSDYTGEAVKSIDAVNEAVTLYAMWIAISLQPRGTGNVYSKPIAQHEGDETVCVLKASGTGKTIGLGQMCCVKVALPQI